MQSQSPQIVISAPNPARPKKSGCGCCGCLFGCLVAFLIPIGILLGIYFTVDFSSMTDQVIDISYRQIFRPKIIETSLSNLKPSEKQAALQLADQFFQDYMTLPKEEKKLIREEILTYIYYDLQNKKVSPDQIPHLNKFIEDEAKKMQNHPALKFLPPDITHP